MLQLQVLGQKLDAGLFGYDILVCRPSCCRLCEGAGQVGSHGEFKGKYNLIDLNLFPGYKGLPNATRLIQE